MRNEKEAKWLLFTAEERRTGVFLTRNDKLIVFSEVVTQWHIDKYGLTRWLYGVPPAPKK